MEKALCLVSQGPGFEKGLSQMNVMWECTLEMGGRADRRRYDINNGEGDWGGQIEPATEIREEDDGLGTLDN